MTPLISVVMPVFDSVEYLDLAIRSIQAQTFADFELLLVDDGSADGSLERAEWFAARDKRLRVWHQDHQGVTAALCHAVAAAGAPLIARMDADDIARPHRLEIQYRFLAAHPEVVAVGSYVQRIDQDGAPIGIGKWPLDHESIDRGLLAGRGGLAHSTAMIRRDALVAVGGYRLEFAVAQDKDLWLRLAEYGRLANVPIPLVDYREHSRSVGATRRRQQQQAVWQAVCAACQRRALPAPAINDRILRRAEMDPRPDWIRTALRWGHYRTAWKYARQLVGERPYWPMTWQLLARFVLAQAWG